MNISPKQADFTVFASDPRGACTPFVPPGHARSTKSIHYVISILKEPCVDVCSVNLPVKLAAVYGPPTDLGNECKGRACSRDQSEGLVQAQIRNCKFFFWPDSIFAQCSWTKFPSLVVVLLKVCTKLCFIIGSGLTVTCVLKVTYQVFPFLALNYLPKGYIKPMSELSTWQILGLHQPCKGHENLFCQGLELLTLHFNARCPWFESCLASPISYTRA